MSASKAKINIFFHGNHSCRCRLCFIASCSISPSIFSDQYVKCVVGCVSLRTCCLMIYFNFSTFFLWHSAALQFEYTCDAPKKIQSQDSRRLLCGNVEQILWLCWLTVSFVQWCLLTSKSFPVCLRCVSPEIREHSIWSDEFIDLP